MSAQVADRVEVGTALLHLGGVQFPVTGPVRYSMTAADGGRTVRADPAAHRGSRALRRLVAFPAERDVIEQEFAKAPHGRPRRRSRWAPIGEQLSVTA